MRTIDLEDQGAFAKLSDEGKEKVIDFIYAHVSVREENLADHDTEPEVNEKGKLTIYTGDVNEFIESEFICYNCDYPDCSWHSGENPSYVTHEHEMLDHVLWHMDSKEENGTDETRKASFQ